jgi:hypothetical protein
LKQQAERIRIANSRGNLEDMYEKAVAAAVQKGKLRRDVQGRGQVERVNERNAHLVRGSEQ